MGNGNRMQARLFAPWEGRRGGRRAPWVAKIRRFLWIPLGVGLLLVIAVREQHRLGKRQTQTALLDMTRAVDKYMADHDGGCPPDVASAASHARLRSEPEDAWGQSFRVRCPSPHGELAYELWSDGPDGKPGGLDRIE